MSEFTIEDYLVEKLAGRLKFLMEQQDTATQIWTWEYKDEWGPDEGMSLESFNDAFPFEYRRDETYDEWKQRMTK